MRIKTNTKMNTGTKKVSIQRILWLVKTLKHNLIWRLSLRCYRPALVVGAAWHWVLRKKTVILK